MSKPKAVLIVHPTAAPLISLENWHREGFKVVVLFPDMSNLSDYLRKGLEATQFDLKLYGNGDVEHDLNLVREQDQFDIVYGYMGVESSVLYGEELLRKLFPKASNDPKTSVWRFSKYAMNERLREWGLPYIKQCRILNQEITPEIENFLKTVSYPVVVKPSFNSAASDKVFFCDSAADVKQRLMEIGTEGYLGKISEVVIQEKVMGEEYLIDAFSYNGKHSVSVVEHCVKHIINKNPVYRYIESLQPDNPIYKKLAEYDLKLLSALGVDFGFSHNEIMLTPQGEVKLIELNLRPSGLSGYINELAYVHQKVNQYTKAADALENRDTQPTQDGKYYCIFLLNNLGFTYKQLNEQKLSTVSSFVDMRVLIPSCDKVPSTQLLSDTVAFLHLANDSQEKLHEDINLLSDYEKTGEVFVR